MRFGDARIRSHPQFLILERFYNRQSYKFAAKGHFIHPHSCIEINTKSKAIPKIDDFTLSSGIGVSAPTLGISFGKGALSMQVENMAIYSPQYTEDSMNTYKSLILKSTDS